MKNLFSFLLKHWALIIAIVVLCWREAFPAALHNDTCALKDYHLNATTLFLSLPVTQPLFRNFWSSEFAPVCQHEETTEQTQPEAEFDVDDTPVISSLEVAIDNIVDWTQSFGVFANSVAEESVLPRLAPFISNKIRATSQSIADSWEPFIVKERIFGVWTTTVEPRIPDTVLLAWQEAFFSPDDDDADDDDDDAQSPANSTTAATMNADDLNNSADIGIARAFFNFVFAAACEKVTNKASQLHYANVMHCCQAAISRAWQQFIDKLRQDALFFCVTFVILLGVIMGVIQMGLCWEQRRKKASKLTLALQNLRRMVDSKTLSFDELAHLV